MEFPRDGFCWEDHCHGECRCRKAHNNRLMFLSRSPSVWTTPSPKTSPHLFFFRSNCLRSNCLTRQCVGEQSGRRRNELPDCHQKSLATPDCIAQNDSARLGATLLATAFYRAEIGHICPPNVHRGAHRRDNFRVGHQPTAKNAPRATGTDLLIPVSKR